MITIVSDIDYMPMTDERVTYPNWIRTTEARYYFTVLDGMLYAVYDEEFADRRMVMQWVAAKPHQDIMRGDWQSGWCHPIEDMAEAFPDIISFLAQHMVL